MNKQRVRYLFGRFLNKTITQEEQDELLQIIESTPEVEFEEVITEFIDSENDEQVSFQEWNNLIATAISFDKQTAEASRFKINYRYIAVAAVLVIIGIAAFFYVNTKSDQYNAISSSSIKPGANKAILVLADGKEISLSNKVDTTKLFALSPTIKSVSDGTLVYNKNEQTAGKNIGVNKLITPKGGQYNIVLPDGTLVWLNSASELKFPAAFSPGLREVELTGEAYFEVAKYPGKKWAFQVKSANQAVQVLGTKFNISAYVNEEVVKTSLIEGKVQVLNERSNKSFILKPGQESALNKTSNEMTVSDAEVDDAIAWKEGLFVFNNENLVTAMNKISRWYDVDIVYQGDLKDKALWGTASRNDKIETLLKTLASTGVAKFKIVGRRVLVMP